VSSANPHVFEKQVPALPHGSAVVVWERELGCELRTESGATATTGSRTTAISTSVIRQGITWSNDRRENVTQDRRSTEPRRSTGQSGPETWLARLRARKAQTGFRTQVSFSKTWENSLQVGRHNAQVGDRMTTRTNADEDGHEMGRQGDGRAASSDDQAEDGSARRSCVIKPLNLRPRELEIDLTSGEIPFLIE
jgi:hypothetical protein